MSRDIENELETALRGVSDSYDDFVNYHLIFTKSDEDRKKLINFINSNNDVKTTDVITYFEDEIDE